MHVSPVVPLGLPRPWLLKTLNASKLTRRLRDSLMGNTLNSEASTPQFIGPFMIVWAKGLVTSIAPSEAPLSLLLGTTPYPMTVPFF